MVSLALLLYRLAQSQSHAKLMQDSLTNLRDQFDAVKKVRANGISDLFFKSHKSACSYLYSAGKEIIVVMMVSVYRR